MYRLDLAFAFNRCKPNFRGSGVYAPRSVDWHPASRCIISLLPRTTDGNQVAPLTREHPRRRYTPVDYPWKYEDPCVSVPVCPSPVVLDYHVYYARGRAPRRTPRRPVPVMPRVRCAGHVMRNDVRAPISIWVTHFLLLSDRHARAPTRQ